MDTETLAKVIAKIHTEDTGQKNCLGSVESTLKELLPSVLEVLSVNTDEITLEDING